MKKKIIFLSYSLNKSDHRGVYQFTKSLVNAASRNNYEIGLFTQVYEDAIFSGGLNEIINYLKDPKGFFIEPNYKTTIIISYLLSKLSKRSFCTLINKEEIGYFSSVNDFNFFVNSELLYYSNNIDLLLPKSMYLKNINLYDYSNQDIIFTDSPLAFKSNRHKVVQTVHDTIPLDEKRKYHRYFYKRLEACCYADKILTISNHSKSKFLEYFPQMHDRVEVVYPPLPADEESIYLSSLPEIQERVLNKYNLKTKEYMYYVGAVEERKNIHNLIEAYTKATLNNKAMPLVISGSVNADYSRKFSLDEILVSFNNYINSKNNILKTDFVSDIEKLCLIRNSRAFLFPTLNEGFGLPVIEAQSLGTPVLTSNNTSLPEVTNGSALMLENPLDIEEIIDCIKTLWSDNILCSQLSKEGLINARRFTKDNFKNEIGDFLANI